jgi:hypothetical protein
MDGMAKEFKVQIPKFKLQGRIKAQGSTTEVAPFNEEATAKLHDPFLRQAKKRAEMISGAGKK